MASKRATDLLTAEARRVSASSLSPPLPQLASKDGKDPFGRAGSRNNSSISRVSTKSPSLVSSNPSSRASSRHNSVQSTGSAASPQPPPGRPSPSRPNSSGAIRSIPARSTPRRTTMPGSTLQAADESLAPGGGRGSVAARRTRRTASCTAGDGGRSSGGLEELGGHGLTTGGAGLTHLVAASRKVSLMKEVATKLQKNVTVGTLPRDPAMMRLISSEARRRHLARPTYQARMNEMGDINPREVLIEAIQDVVAAAKKCVKSGMMLRATMHDVRVAKLRAVVHERMPPIKAKTLAVDRIQNVYMQVKKQETAEDMWQRLANEGLASTPMCSASKKLGKLDPLPPPSPSSTASPQAASASASQHHRGSWVWARRASSVARALMPTAMTSPRPHADGGHDPSSSEPR